MKKISVICAGLLCSAYGVAMSLKKPAITRRRDERSRLEKENKKLYYKICNIAKDNTIGCEPGYSLRHTLVDTQKTFAQLWEDLKNRDVVSKNLNLTYVLMQQPILDTRVEDIEFQTMNTIDELQQRGTISKIMPNKKINEAANIDVNRDEIDAFFHFIVR